MLNKVILIGRMVVDPELKYTPTGIATCSFRIAVDRPFSKKEGAEKETDFIDVVTWRQSAEFTANYLTKGRLVAVDGRLQIRNWTAQDGTKRKTAEVVANDIRSLDKPKDGSGPAAVPAAPAAGGEPDPMDDYFGGE